MAGMSRAAFRCAFSTLIEVGAVRPDYGTLRIVDRAALELAAEAD